MARTPFPVTVVANGVTKTINTAPAWARHKIRRLVEINGSSTFDGQTKKVNKAQQRELYELAYRFGV
jgi:hypothetical protein